MHAIVENVGEGHPRGRAVERLRGTWRRHSVVVPLARQLPAAEAWRRSATRTLALDLIDLVPESLEAARRSLAPLQPLEFA